MAKTEVIPFKDFMEGHTHKKKEHSHIPMIVSTTTTMQLVPVVAFAQGTDSFGTLHGAVMSIVDWGAVIIIIVSGGNFMLGNRSRAMELLTGVSIGYIIARHSVDIRDFLKSI